MKLKIKVKRINKGLILPEVIDKGDWIDLRAAEDITIWAPQAGTLKKKIINDKECSLRDVTFDYKLIPLGIAMHLPDGFEAIILPRSSTFKKFGVICANSQGIIDNSYCGDTDEWQFPAIGIKNAVICKGDRICQFRIQLSQKATFWQKFKWFISSSIKIIEVDELGNPNRGGIGSTGIK